MMTKTSDRIGYIVFAHGSSVESANDGVRMVAGELGRQGQFEAVEAAFLEGGTPDLRGAVESLVSLGIRRIVVIPYFLTLGLHLKRDLPRLVDEVTALHHGVRVDVTAPLDGHSALIEALLGRAKEGACAED
jgi:sirohydrochlorin ferrochelatase